MSHEAGARAEDREVEPPLPHEPELVRLDRLAQLVVADLEIGSPRLHRRVADAGDLPVAPVLQRLRGRRVMAMAVDDHGWKPLVGSVLVNTACRLGPEAWSGRRPSSELAIEGAVERTPAAS